MASLHHQALSLTAVFVALAVGMAAGAAAVGSRVAGDEKLVSGIERRFAALQDRLQQAAERERRSAALVAAYERALERMAAAAVRPRAQGAEVRVEAAGDAAPAADDLARLLARAGFRVTRGPAPMGGGFPAVVVSAGGRRVTGFVGAPAARGPAAFSGPPPAAAAGDGAASRAGVHGATEGRGVAWTWEAGSAAGRVALLAALVCEALSGPLDLERATGCLEGLSGHGPPGERGRPGP